MRTAFIFIASLLTIVTALWLRLAKGDPLRENVTKILGYENRALVEHLLAAVAIPLMLSLIFFIVWWILEKFLEFLRLEFVGHRLTRRRTAVLPLDKLADPQIVFFETVFLAFVYCIAAFWFEWQQAAESVYGGPARGWFQYKQFAADFLGAVLAALASWLMARRYHVGTTHPRKRTLRD